MKTNYVCNKFFLIAIGVLISLIQFECVNQKKQPLILDKDTDIKIFLDSTNLYIELTFNTMFFHVENMSRDNILLTLDSEKDTSSRKSLLLITPFQDTIPIWYRIPNQYYYIFPPMTSTSFAGNFERKKIFEKLPLRSKGTIGSEYLKEIIAESRIIYLPDKEKVVIKEEDLYLDTIYCPKSILSAEKTNNKFIWHGDTYTGVFYWKLESEPLKNKTN